MWLSPFHYDNTEMEKKFLELMQLINKNHNTLANLNSSPHQILETLQHNSVCLDQIQIVGRQQNNQSLTEYQKNFFRKFDSIVMSMGIMVKNITKWFLFNSDKFQQLSLRRNSKVCRLEICQICSCLIQERKNKKLISEILQEPRIIMSFKDKFDSYEDYKENSLDYHLLNGVNKSLGKYGKAEPYLQNLIQQKQIKNSSLNNYLQYLQLSDLQQFDCTGDKIIQQILISIKDKLAHKLDKKARIKLQRVIKVFNENYCNDYFEKETFSTFQQTQREAYSEEAIQRIITENKDAINQVNNLQKTLMMLESRQKILELKNNKLETEKAKLQQKLIFIKRQRDQKIDQLDFVKNKNITYVSNSTQTAPLKQKEYQQSYKLTKIVTNSNGISKTLTNIHFNQNQLSQPPPNNQATLSNQEKTVQIKRMQNLKRRSSIANDVSYYFAKIQQESKKKNIQVNLNLNNQLSNKIVQENYISDQSSQQDQLIKKENHLQKENHQSKENHKTKRLITDYKVSEAKDNKAASTQPIRTQQNNYQQKHKNQRLQRKKMPISLAKINKLSSSQGRHKIAKASSNQLRNPKLQFTKNYNSINQSIESNNKLSQKSKLSQNNKIVKHSKNMHQRYFTSSDLQLFGSINNNNMMTKINTKLRMNSSQQMNLEIISNHIDNLKHFKNNFYLSVMSFLKNPYQTVQKQQLISPVEQLSILQLQEKIKNIIIYHKINCNQNYCHHLQVFYDKIGLPIPQ